MTSSARAASIARRVVITAAHCVNSGHGFYTNWVFIPGYDGTKTGVGQARPFGTWTWASAEIPSNWLNTDGSLPNDTDFAAIVFADQSRRLSTLCRARPASTRSH